MNLMGLFRSPQNELEKGGKPVPEEDAGIRTEIDLRNEKIGFKVREAQMMKIPYMFVLRDREAENRTVTIRNRKGDNLGTVSFEEAVAMIKKLNDERTID